MSDSDSSSECCFGKSYGSPENTLPYDQCLLSLLKDRFLCDLIIRVGDNTRPAHRVILSAASGFFRELLKDTKPLKQESEEIDLTNVFTEAVNLDEILAYIYSGYVNLTDTSVKALLQVNKVLAMPALNNQCAQFLLTKMRPLNCLETWETAWKYNLQELISISLIVCRETLYDLLIINGNIAHLSGEFLSMFVANKEVLATLKPDSVVRMLLWWTHAQPIDVKNKKEKFLSLLAAYLEWKIFSEIEFESITIAICRCSEDFPELTGDINSWLNDRYNGIKSMQLLRQKNDETGTSENSFNPHSLRHRQNWSLLVAEKHFRSVGIYCNTKSKWFTMELEDNPLKAFGFISNHMVFEQKSNALLLKNVSTMTSWTLSSPIYNTTGIVRCTGANEATFFLYLDNIYSVDAITRVDNKDLICLFNRWDYERRCWDFMLHLTPEIVRNDIHFVSLKVETSYGDNVYFFLTVKLTPDNRQSTRFNPQPGENDTCGSTASGFSGKSATILGEKNSSVCMKSLEIFYVYRINMKDYTYRQIGKRRCEPAILNANRKIILEDKILFLLDPDRDMESKFRYAFYYKNDCFLNCLSLSFDGDNSWANLSLRAPFPGIRDISIKKRDRICLDSFVTTCKNILFVGTHWSPHVFQVIMYDVSNLTVSVLPAVPLPAIRPMSIYALHTHQPVNDILTEETRTVDLLNFHFKDWSLLSWQGTSSLT